MISPQNPVGLKGIDYLEFGCANLLTPTATHFTNLGFSKVSENSDKSQVLFQQGQIRFLLNAHPNSHATRYFAAHDEGVSRMSFRVENLEQSLEVALKRGGKLKEDVQIFETPQGKIKKAAIQGFGDVLNEFIERPSDAELPGHTALTTDPTARPLKQRFSRIDHLTNNVPRGERLHWAEFYKTVYGFVETRYFDIKGKKTGLYSTVVQLKDNNVIIPINEPESDQSKSQIQEFLNRHKGAGVQHIALMTADILSSVPDLIDRGFKFLDVPNTYYEDIPKRNFKVEESIANLQKNNILVDGDPEGYLLQIFSDTYIGPLFFEFIQRKNHWGFGEGNFQALFDAMERDQMKRGLL
ncbi:MAG: 4-hydroxyphenylpyruvate dioxygenase [Bacteriovoracaceae bacterium]|nr:4-hydroxyphenylpyruvate dioxygenase [Bacteriovoracaceae bacterium]